MGRRKLASKNMCIRNRIRIKCIEPRAISTESREITNPIQILLETSDLTLEGVRGIDIPKTHENSTTIPITIYAEAGTDVEFITDYMEAIPKPRQEIPATSTTRNYEYKVTLQQNTHYGTDGSDIVVRVYPQ